MTVRETSTGPLAVCVAVGWLIAGRWPRPRSASSADPANAPSSAEPRPCGGRTATTSSADRAQRRTQFRGDKGPRR
jgi:hypothetical protein